MDINKDNWLDHLKDLPSDISGYKTCTYLMALEGWRRGLTLKFRIRTGVAIPPSIQYSLSDGKKEHWFTVARGDKVTEEAIKICMEKPKTYEYLRKRDIPIPEGNDFSSETSDDEIIKYAEELGFPLVLKPTDAGSGRGVITDIRTIEQFKQSLNHVRNKLGFKDVIVERFIKGEDYRVYVLGDKVIGAYRREAANIIGDGIHDIQQLIKYKNKIRSKNPFIKNRLIKIDENLKAFLKQQGKSLTYVPAEGEKVYLRAQGERLSERDPVDITDEMPDHIKQIAVNAMKSIPGLPHCDVDMLVNEETGEGFVNEINSRPQISNHLFPLSGLARDIPKEIIDYYFPETKNTPRNDLYYFDFEPVYQAFRSKNVREIVIPKVPKNHELTRFRITGDFQRINYKTWVRRMAVRQNLYGYVKQLKNGQISIVVSGTPSRLKNFRNVLNANQPKRAKIETIEEYRRTRPIKIGFKIIETEGKKRSNPDEKIEKELQYYKIKYEQMLQSKSWKITRPLRAIKKLFKS